MKDSRHIIWTDYLDYDDWKEDLEAQYPELSANERMNLMYRGETLRRSLLRSAGQRKIRRRHGGYYGACRGRF